VTTVLSWRPETVDSNDLAWSFSRLPDHLRARERAMSDSDDFTAMDDPDSWPSMAAYATRSRR
jgi:hypothetical protein